MILLVKHLLYTEKYTIDGARQRIEQFRRTGELKKEAVRAASRQTLSEVESALNEILDTLDGKARPTDPASSDEPAA
jgi:hypothetical protein